MLYCLKYHGCTSLCNGDETLQSLIGWSEDLAKATLVFSKADNESA